MEEDETEIQKMVDALNEKFPPAKWDSVKGHHGLSNVTLGTFGGVDPSSILIVKNFVNLETWEIKSFYYERFIKGKKK